MSGLPERPARVHTALDAFASAAEELGVPLKVVRDSREGGRERYEAAFLLVRPDQFVAWASEDAPADPAGILKRAVGTFPAATSPGGSP